MYRATDWLEMGWLLVLAQLLPLGGSPRTRGQSQSPLSHAPLPPWPEGSWPALLTVGRRPCLGAVTLSPSRSVATLTDGAVQHCRASRALPPQTHRSDSQQKAALASPEAELLLPGTSATNPPHLLFQLFICLTSEFPIAVRQEKYPLEAIQPQSS